MLHRRPLCLLAVLLALFTVAPSATFAQSKPSLKRGSTGAYVREAQSRLNIWIDRAKPGLARLPITGTFGPQTERTVIAFQRYAGLPQIGVIGPRTWAALPPLRGSGRTTPASDDRAGCEPSYPTICIPVNSYDLDCPDIPYRRFPVRGSDPHRFDGDNDGIGCER